MSTTARPTFNDPALHQEIMRLRTVDHATNLGFLAIEYGCLAAIIGGAIAFRELRRESALSWWWDVPVLGLGIVLVGALQHRLAGLGHEAAHYSLLKNKLLNDLIGDVFCMFPICTSPTTSSRRSPTTGWAVCTGCSRPGIPTTPQPSLSATALLPTAWACLPSSTR